MIEARNIARMLTIDRRGDGMCIGINTHIYDAFALG